VSSPDNLLLRIFEGMPQPLWVVSHSGRIVFANPASMEVLGYDNPTDLYGKDSHDTVHYKHPDGSPYLASECPMLTCRFTGETVRGEDEWFIRRDGSMFPITWWSAPIDLPDGRGAVVAFTDITDRRHAEQVMRERDAAERRAEQARAAQRRGVEAEAAARETVARDLHDGAQQRLVALLLSLELAREEFGSPPASAAELLDQARDLAGQAVDELRELARGVYPSILTTRGLAAAVEEVARQTPLPVSVQVSNDARFPSAIEANAYFTITEALTNAVKHARASRVLVEIRTENDALILEVADDGVGGADLSRAGNGLHSMMDRIAALGGSFSLESPEGVGTKVLATIPTPSTASLM
jgi:PAS domain S-box-containing protein